MALTDEDDPASESPAEAGGSRTDLRRRERLKRAALHYLDRYLASEQDLRRVLDRRIRRAMAADPALAGSDPDAAEARQAWRAAAVGDIDAVVAACVRTGLIDDGRYVEAKAASGRRRGWSARRIAATLKAHGVDEGLVRAGLSTEDDEAEIAAAMRLIVRRRIGPAARTIGARDRQKDLAAVMRGGFSGAVARQALERVAREKQADDGMEPGDEADEAASSAPENDGAPDDDGTPENDGARRDGRRQGRGPSQRW